MACSIGIVSANTAGSGLSVDGVFFSSQILLRSSFENALVNALSVSVKSLDPEQTMCMRAVSSIFL